MGKPDAVKLDFQRVGTHWNQGFIAFGAAPDPWRSGAARARS